MPAKKPAQPTSLDAFRHRDKRTNIPTEELRDFVADYEARPGAWLRADGARIDAPASAALGKEANQ
jgi:adenine-specific DNA-methyltransferase